MTAITTLMLVTDVGFVAYWAATALELIPPEFAYSDYHDARVVAWNWSFLPLDLLISVTGIAAVAILGRRPLLGRPLMTISLALTHASGLLAISYWAVRGEFQPEWWVPNLFLLVYPIPALVRLLRHEPRTVVQAR
ncbi:DUF5360 family protein [Pseudonocardia sp. CA-107938]|uniref:DUF5360 family protein n=1 Tax=Pseudonocardia sp. CA-107938 TaxID=3240021 RepID=UPI003D8FF0AA